MPKDKNNEYRMRIEYEEWPIEKSRNLSDYIQPETETTILTPRLNFNTTKIFISIIMTSNPENLNQRKKIRMSIDMMKNYNGNNVVVNFFIGLSENSTINKELKQESDYYNDIIQESFDDSFYNSTITDGMILKWVTKNCQNTKYIMITHDDIYINIENLIQSIFDQEKHIVGGSLLMGRLKDWEQPVKKPFNQWYIPDYEYNDKYYPFYLDSSLGYVMSTNIAKKLYEISLTETFIHFGDVFFTGICAKKAGLIHTHNADFTRNCLTEFKGCSSIITCLNGCKKN
ncbi:hypothetical protein HCN44_010637 [Aphidius gifuensis]|uniref:Hexosyltransferase n=1 Tax=Aphidius gifuensis TaxID=684658 RepID=A0A834XTB6_APHGI|nr:hypothetical protein HCN44_010637 [Aphidius gifuensis]